jgi:hypothetical protein
MKFIFTYISVDRFAQVSIAGHEVTFGDNGLLQISNTIAVLFKMDPVSSEASTIIGRST